jgi:hypothetical protein
MNATQNLEEKKRKNYPGDERTPGTKDYSMILGNLIHYKHQLVQEENEQKIGDLLMKISVKLKELGFKAESDSIKKKVGRRKANKFQNITMKKKQDGIDVAVKCWDKGTEKNEKAKEENKAKN